MPKALERKLKRQAKAKGFGKERTGAYVYGTLRETGWKPSREKRNPLKSPATTGWENESSVVYKRG